MTGADGDDELDRWLDTPTHDVEAEAGDEEAMGDLFFVDRTEARSLGVDLDAVAGLEPELT